MKHTLLLTVALLVLASNPAWAFKRPDSSIARHLFPAKMVMRHQDEIGLTDEQQEKIRAAMKKTQNEFFDLNWEIEKATGALEQTVQQNTINEEQALSQMEKVLKLENQLKKERLKLLVRIKNMLTPEQRSKLKEIKQSRMMQRPAGRRPMNGGRFQEGPGH